MAAPTVEDQVRDNIHACPFIAPDEYRFVSSNSVGMRHPALPLIVELAQNELALSQLVKNNTGIQLSGLRHHGDAHRRRHAYAIGSHRRRCAALRIIPRL